MEILEVKAGEDNNIRFDEFFSCIITDKMIAPEKLSREGIKFIEQTQNNICHHISLGSVDKDLK